MSKLTKDHYLASEMMIVISMIEHVRDNLDDSIFEDEEELETLFETLLEGAHIAMIRMKQMLRDDTCPYC